MARRTAVLAAMFSLAAVATAQEASPPERTFFAPIVVSVINVEVYVTDRDNRPLVGLTSDDFEILEDGEPVEITNFFAAPGVVAQGQPVGAPLSPEVDADQDLYLILFVDDGNLSAASRRRARDALDRFLDRLPDNTYVMLAQFAGSLRVLQDFTNDMDLVGSALVELEQGGGSSLRADANRIRREMQTLANQTSRVGDPLPTDRSLRPLEIDDYGARSAINFIQHIKSYAAAALAQSEETIAGLERLVRSVAGLRGRKAILVIGDGIEASPGAELFIAWEQIFTTVSRATSVNPSLEAQNYDLSEPLGELARQAVIQRVTVHALGTERGSVAASAGADQAGGVTLMSGFSSDARAKISRAETYLAGVTGGRVLVNGRRLDDELAALAVELSSYYSLGYRPRHAGDGRYHRIKVNVKATERRALHYREGYQDVGDADRIADRTLTAAMLGLTENPLAITAEFREQQPSDDGLYVVPIVIRVPLAELSLIPQAADHEGRVSITIAVQDELGSLAEMQRREYPVKIPHNQFLSALQEHAEFIIGLRMREGAQRVAIGVRDELGNLDSTVTVNVNVGELDL